MLLKVNMFCLEYCRSRRNTAKTVLSFDEHSGRTECCGGDVCRQRVDVERARVDPVKTQTAGQGSSVAAQHRDCAVQRSVRLFSGLFEEIWR